MEKLNKQGKKEELSVFFSQNEIIRIFILQTFHTRATTAFYTSEANKIIDMHKFLISNVLQLVLYRFYLPIFSLIDKCAFCVNFAAKHSYIALLWNFP